MSKYDAELRQRILSGDGMGRTCEWFIRRIANEPKIQWTDFTPLERQFYKNAIEGYLRWRKLCRTHFTN
jgi:hypothetical protein